MAFHAIPILRIFVEEKARDFYLGFLGMTLDWEHRFETGFPIYMQVSRDNLIFHLSEHSGDCTPGAKVFVNTNELDNLHSGINRYNISNKAKGYKYSRPEITTAPWGAREFEVTDPFTNRILFNENENN